jgi:NAD(P)-dependent dehydrogenase (short-subunit alcohol dehydrogenase family)
LGSLDLAVLNAGTYARDAAAQFDAVAFRATVEVNLMGSVHCLAALESTATHLTPAAKMCLLCHQRQQFCWGTH